MWYECQYFWGSPHLRGDMGVSLNSSSLLSELLLPSPFLCQESAPFLGAAQLSLICIISRYEYTPCLHTQRHHSPSATEWKRPILKSIDASRELQHRRENEEHQAFAPTFLRPAARGSIESLPSSLSSWPLSPALFLEPPCSLHGISSHILASFSLKAHPKVLSLRSLEPLKITPYSLGWEISVPFWFDFPFQVRVGVDAGGWAPLVLTQWAHKTPSKPKHVHTGPPPSATQNPGRNPEASFSFMQSVVSKNILGFPPHPQCLWKDGGDLLESKLPGCGLSCVSLTFMWPFCSGDHKLLLDPLLPRLLSHHSLLFFLPSPWLLFPSPPRAPLLLCFSLISDLQRSVAQQCKYAPRYWTVHLKMVKMVNLMWCGFYLNLKKKKMMLYEGRVTPQKGRVEVGVEIHRGTTDKTIFNSI